MNLKFVTAAILALASGSVQAETIQSGLPGCRSKSDLDGLTSAIVSRDQKSANHFYATGKCRVMPVGETVTVVGRAGFGAVEIFHRGVRYVTPSEAISK